MHLSRKILPLATLLGTPKLNVSPLVWCKKGWMDLLAPETFPTNEEFTGGPWL